MDTEQKLSGIRSRIQAVTQEETRNEILREQLTEERAKAMDALKEELKVESVEAAKVKRDKLKKNLDTIFKKLEEKLDSMGA